MKSSKLLFKDLEKIQIAKAENFPLLKKYFESDQKITFFSWKMFDIQLDKNNQPVFGNTFDAVNAKKFINQELSFLRLLKKYNISFEYIKIIPDELPVYFWGVKNLRAKMFLTEVASFFKQFYSNTRVILFTELLAKNKLSKLYSRVFKKVYLQKPYSLGEFENEVKIRFCSKDLTRKAFALFAAESAILYELSKNIFPNLILLAGKRSSNTYKYEFYKFPGNRPVLPKLFVI